MPFGADEMFALVGDIERYPEFLPWCAALKIRSRQEDAGRTVLVADMTISFKVVRETFGSRIILNPLMHQIDVSYVDGPFRYLQNRWRFEARGENASMIDFFIDFEFRNRALGLMIGAVFHKAVAKLVSAFEARARALHTRADHAPSN